MTENTDPRIVKGSDGISRFIGGNTHAVNERDFENFVAKNEALLAASSTDVLLCRLIEEIKGLRADIQRSTPPTVRGDPFINHTVRTS